MNLLIANVFVAVMLAVLALYSTISWHFLGPRVRVKERLADLAKKPEQPGAEESYVLRVDELSRIPLLNRMMRRLSIARNLQRVIEQAGMSITAGGVLLIMLVCGELALIVSLKLDNPFLSAACFLLFGSLPLFYVLGRRQKRMKMFGEQFPDALDMMISALRAGHAMGRAMQLVATEAPEPTRTEFRKTFEEQNLGLPLREALLNLAERVDNMDLRLFITAVVIQRESGGNLTEILSKIGKTIRARFALLGQIQVYTAQGRATAWILGILPVAVGLIIYAIAPDYVMFLFQDRAGRVLLGLAVFLQILGYLTIRKIVRVKVY